MVVAKFSANSMAYNIEIWNDKFLHSKIFFLGRHRVLSIDCLNRQNPMFSTLDRAII